MSNEGGIRILRFQHSYKVLNSCLISRELKLTVHIQDDIPFYIHPFQGYLPDLKAKFGDKETSVVPYFELSTLLNETVTLETIKGILLRTFSLSQTDLEDYDNIAVIIIPPHDTGYNELTLTWTESIENLRKKGHIITLSIPGPLLFNNFSLIN